jgi:hypothetical protein
VDSGDSFSYVRCAILTVLKHKHNCNGHRLKTTKKFCWVHFGLMASLDVIAFQATEAYASIDLTRVVCNVYRHLRDEKGKEQINALKIYIPVNGNEVSNLDILPCLY